MALNERQKLFVKHYVRTRNATKAAILAGYSERTAGSQAHDLLKKPEISNAVQKMLTRVNEREELRAADVLAEIRRLAFADLSTAYNDDGTLKHPKDMPRSIRAALQSVETDELFAGRGKSKRKVGLTKKIRIADKVRSLEMLAKHFKLLTDVHEVSGKDGGPQVVLLLPANGSEAPGADQAPQGTQPSTTPNDPPADKGTPT